MFHRVIQMIDENKEQLRNLFRKHTVVDVQPAISDKLPDDITTLQVCEARTPANPQAADDVVWSLKPLLLFTAGHHHPGCSAVLGRNSVCHNELALPQSVRTLRQFCIDVDVFI